MRNGTRGWILFVAGLVLAFTAGPARAEHSPPGDVDASCGPDGEVTLEEGTRFEIVLTYSGSTSDVTFTAAMNENDFFGAAQTFDSFTVPGNDPTLGVIRRFTIDTSGFPATTDQVLIEVTSSDTGSTVVGTCDFNLTILVDTDDDGLLDVWEIDGIDADGDGTVDLALGQAPFNADPQRKDVFLEIDYMDCAAGGCAAGDTHTHQPAAGAIQDVVDAFAIAPVDNPDGSTGITLHAMLDESIQDLVNFAFSTPGSGSLDDFDDLKLGGSGTCDGAFGTADDRAASNCVNILAAKRLAFRYAIFGHSASEGPTASGWAEITGNDLIVTFGMWTQSQINSAGGQRAAEAGTLMHELGHTLGLNHGGADAINCKPNYLSVMSWSVQLLNFDPSRPLDYSSNALDTLDENSLSEPAGINGPAGRFAIYGLGGATMLAPADGAIDWDGDGDATENPVQDLDINQITAAGCGASAGEQLEGYDDWANLRYSFRGDDNFADGVHILPPNHGEDVTSERSIAMADSVDFDGDGLSNLDDNCAAVANPDQRDIDGDDLGDVCDESNVVEIDIKPESSTNPIRRSAPGTTTVAILSSAIFDAPGEVDRSSLRFGRTGNENSLARCNAVSEDVNGDLLPDLICHFVTRRAGFQLGDTEGVMTGQTITGLVLLGTDTVRIVP